ncbi:PadR family transcriptional regulator [Streptococcus cameli]
MKRNPALPLTETSYYILLSFLEPRHGYAVMQEVEKMSQGDVKIAAGTMYGAIDNLLKSGWILPVASQDARRKTYQISPLGKELLQHETQRIRKLSRIAEKLDF